MIWGSVRKDAFKFFKSLEEKDFKAAEGLFAELNHKYITENEPNVDDLTAYLNVLRDFYEQGKRGVSIKDRLPKVKEEFIKTRIRNVLGISQAFFDAEIFLERTRKEDT